MVFVQLLKMSNILVILLVFFREASSSSNNSETDLDDLISHNLDDVKFYLYSNNRAPLEFQEIIMWDIDSLEKSNYNTALPLKILVHGFMSNSTDIGGFVQRIKNAYLATNAQANILVVDWGPLSTIRDRLPLMPYYYKATRNVPLVGEHVSRMISFLMSQGTSTDHIHIIGFSLGAHVSGIAGYHVLLNSSNSIGRISGLDPAGPVFQNKNAMGRLDSTDATFVDVVHSNQGKNGYKGALGHADFYPNGGGPKQPGCQNVTEPVRFLVGLCAHQFAYKLYEKSILEPNNITACQCESLFTMPCRKFNFDAKQCQNPAIFGDQCPSSVRGEFYMKVALEDENLTILDH